MKICVNNLLHTTTDDELRRLFATYGTVDRVQIVRNRRTGRSLRYGYVAMPHEAEGQAAIAGLHEKPVLGAWPLILSEQRPLQPPPDEHAQRAALRKAPVSGIWLLPQPKGGASLHPDPDITRDLDISTFHRF